MKKTKLIATIMTICLAISTLAYGVYAATNLSFTIGANIAFTVDNLFVDVDAFVYNAYNQEGNTRLGTAQTLSDSSSVTALSQAIMDNSDGLSVIDDTDLEWDLTGQNLYFNSSDITEKMTFRIEVKNYSPSSQIKVTIAPTVATATALDNAEISGGSENAVGSAIAYNGTTAETAVAEYTLALTDLATPINQTTIDFTVNIDEYSPYDIERSFTMNDLTAWAGTTALGTKLLPFINEDNELIEWYSDSACLNLVSYEQTLASEQTFYGIVFEGYNMINDSYEIFPMPNGVGGYIDFECSFGNADDSGYISISTQYNFIVPYVNFEREGGVLYRVVDISGGDHNLRDYYGDYNECIWDFTATNAVLKLPLTVKSIDNGYSSTSMIGGLRKSKLSTIDFSSCINFNYVSGDTISPTYERSGFSDSANLKEVIFGVESLTTHGVNAFDNCPALESIYVPNQTAKANFDTYWPSLASKIKVIGQ